MLAQLKPNADVIAARNLDRQGFVTFRPLERQVVVRHGRLHSRTRPLFPGYMFVNYTADNAPWSRINSTYGVVRLVKFGDRPALVPPQIVYELQSACDEEGYVTLSSRFVLDSEVKIESGAFTNFVGRIEQISPNDRALVLIDLMGTQTRVNISMENLKISASRNIQDRIS